MKRNVLSIALLVVLAGMTVSCQKENLVEPQTSMAEKSAVYTVTYDVDGFQQSVAIHNDTEEQVMMQYFLSIAQVGSSVVFFDEEAYSQSIGTKDTQIHTTASETDAAIWCLKRIRSGYHVSVAYDSEKNEYVCIAIK